MDNNDVLKEQDAPLTGIPRYRVGTPGGPMLRDNEGNVTSEGSYNLSNSSPSVNDASARIGDYVLQKGKAVVVPDSPTDLSQKYKIAIGGTEKPNKDISFWNVAGATAQGAGAGAAIGSMLLPGIGTGIGAAIGGFAGALQSINGQNEAAMKAWLDENVKYDTAVEFYRDDNGDLKYKLDYEKMGTGGARSGSGVKEAQNRETQVSLGDDGRLKVTVSPIFASTQRFKEIIDWISENYGGLTKDTENYEQILEEIKNGIDGETKSFITNMRLYADYANRYPDASPESIVAGYMTEVSGYIDPDKMDEFEMTIIKDDGVETSTAKDFFDSVYNMNKDDRSRLVEKLNKIAFEGEGEYTDGERAVAYGELKALWAVSENPEKHENSKYQDMLGRDWWVALIDSFRPLGLNTADVLHFVSGGNLFQTKQEYLKNDDFASFVGTVGSVYVGYKGFKLASKGLELALKRLPMTSSLFAASLEGRVGGGLAQIAQFKGETDTLRRAVAASGLFKTLKIGIFDAALAGTKTLVSGSDFLTEFGSDFGRDILLEMAFSYYDMIGFQKAVDDATVEVLRDKKTGNIYRKPVEENLEPIDDSLETVGSYNIMKTRAGDTVGIIQSEYGNTYYVNGKVVHESANGEPQTADVSPSAQTDVYPILKEGISQVDVDANAENALAVQNAMEKAGIPKDGGDYELMSASGAASAELAGKMAKFDTSKVGLAINKALFNKNAALDAANEIALAKTGDRTAWQNRSQSFVDVTDNANQEKNKLATGYYLKSSERIFNEYDMALGKLNLNQRYSKKDANYLKAAVQLERAQYLDNHKLKEDPRNYTQEALEKYGDAIASVPDDRAAILEDFLEKRKARHDITKASARKSGKIDIKKLDSFMEADLQKEIGWVPQWGKKQTYVGLLDQYYGISQERNIYKDWLHDGEWVELDKLEDPLVADDRFLNFVTTNMGITNMVEATADALNDAGLLVDNTPTSETIRERKLRAVKNKDELTKKFDDMIEAKKKEIKEKVPSQKQYKEQMQKLVEDSGVMSSIEKAIDYKPKSDEAELTDKFNGKGIGNFGTFVSNNVVGDKPSKRSQKALEYYQGEAEGSQGKYKNINGVLRGEIPLDSLQEAEAKRIGKIIENLDKSFTQKSNSPMLLWRSVKATDFPKVGEDITELAFLSTSASPRFVKQRAMDWGGNTVFYAYLIPEGQPLSVLSDIGEQEILLPRGTTGTVSNVIFTGRGPLVVVSVGNTSVNDVVKNPITGALSKSEQLMSEANEYNKIFGYDFDVESYANTSLLPNLKDAINAKSMTLAASVINQAITDVAPYRSRSELLKSAQDEVAQEWREWAEKNIKAGKATNKDLKQFVEDNNLTLPDDKRPLKEKIKHGLWQKVLKGEKLPNISDTDLSGVVKKANGLIGSQDKASVKQLEEVKKEFNKILDGSPLFQSSSNKKAELVDLVAQEINASTLDAYKMGAATTATGLGGKYPITWFKKGKPYTRFITYRNKEEQRLAEEITRIFNDKQLVKQPGIISRAASIVANDFRLLTTAVDPSRAALNLARDTGRGYITSGGEAFMKPDRLFNNLLELGDYSDAEKVRLSKALSNVSDMVAGETYNAAYRNPRQAKVQATKKYLKESGANPLKRFTYSLTHTPSSILEAPADFFEGMTRRRLAKSAAVVKLRQLQLDGASVEEQVKAMTDAAFFAGREYTANFKRKGKLIGAMSKYVAYQSSSYAGVDGMKRALINNPSGVSRNFAAFLIMYLILLGDTLADEESRKDYYRLSDYDRGNSLVISLGDNTVVTIPLDQEVAALLFPYRRFMETLNGTDPVSFFEFIWGTLTEPMPMDLSGFSEGGYFNLQRGLEKLASQNMPNIASGVLEASTGYDLYYGNDRKVTDEMLKDYGIYDPSAGDYTTTGKNSMTLREIANATGIPQWQLQVMLENYGGNVGQYILNILDKFKGATEEEQGGKDFANAIFKSFVATDQDAAANEFYDGIKQLQQEKKKVIQAVANYNKDMQTATGEAKVALQEKLQKAKDDYAVKVADFVDKYVSAYEITGGLPKSQAMQVYYLFRFDDDDTVYQSGSVEEFYKNKAEQQFKNQATAMSAPILDKYYNNRIGNIYQDADGNWRRYLSSGTQAMRNSIYGEGEEHMVNLLNTLEGKTSSLKSLRTKVKDARSKAYEAKDYDLADKLGYDFDRQVIEAISPYIEKYGAENVLGNNEVLDYLSDWFFVPDDFKKTKRGGYVSLAHNASSQEAFVRPFIKFVFGLPTDYYSYSDTALTSPTPWDFGR